LFAKTIDENKQIEMIADLIIPDILNPPAYTIYN